MAAVRPLYIEKDDGVGSIISRVEEVGDKNLALVFPQKSEVFSDLAELKFLKKQIEKTEKRVVLITQDDAQADLAKSLGFKVKKDLEDDFQDEFLESFYQSEDSERSKNQPSPKEDRSTSKSKKEAEIKKKRLQVSDIVAPNQAQKREKPERPKRAKKTQKKESQNKNRQLSSVEEVYKSSTEDKEDGDNLSQNVTSQAGGSGLWGWFSFPKLIGILFLSSLVALVLTVTYAFPKAEIKLEPHQDSRKVAFSLTVDKTIASPDLDKSLIPGEVFKREEKVAQTFDSTGKEDVENKARGTVKVYNSFSSSPQTLIKTTRLLSESGKLFHLEKTIEVPGADIENGEIKPNYIEAEVIATEPGSDYNIGPSEFKIPGFKESGAMKKYEGFYAVSEEPMEGGKIGTIEKVTEEDKKKALDNLEKNLLSEVKKDLKESIPEDLKVIQESFSLELQGVDLNPEVGEEGKEFQIQATGTAKAFALREDYVKRIIKDELRENMEKEQKVIEESIEVAYKNAALNFEEGTATLEVEADAEVTWEVDKEEFKAALKGKNEVGARKVIADYSQIKSVQVRLWPFWLRKIPEREDKIEIKVQ